MITDRSGDGEKADEVKPTARPLEVLFAWAPGGGPNDRIAIRRRDVLFGFTAKALEPRRRPDGSLEWKIEADWVRNPRFRGDYVFLRTRNAIVRTGWDTIEAAMANLGPLPLFGTHHGTFVNLDAVGPMDFGEKVKRLGFRVGDPRISKVEWVLVSRRRARDL